jgi:hypothetical protein
VRNLDHANKFYGEDSKAVGYLVDLTILMLNAD